MNLKEEFNEFFIHKLANELLTVHTGFNWEKFVKATFTDDWQNKELKERMRFITSKMHKFLPLSYVEQIQIIKEVAPKFSGIQGFVFPDFVQVYGLEDF